MTLEEAFTKFLSTRSHGLPWEIGQDDLRAIFTAGWHAHYEASRQTDLFPGTLSSEQAPYHASCPAGVTGQAHRTCNAEESVQVGCGAGSISAEDIYAAWPVKKARGAAILAIKKAMKKEAPDKLLAAVKELAGCYAQWPAAEKQYLPMCSTFMNQERWADDRTTWRKGAAAAPSQFRETK